MAAALRSWKVDPAGKDVLSGTAFQRHFIVYFTNQCYDTGGACFLTTSQIMPQFPRKVSSLKLVLLDASLK